MTKKNFALDILNIERRLYIAGNTRANVKWYSVKQYVLDDLFGSNEGRLFQYYPWHTQYVNSLLSQKREPCFRFPETKELFEVLKDIPWVIEKISIHNDFEPFLEMTFYTKEHYKTTRMMSSEFLQTTDGALTYHNTALFPSQVFIGERCLTVSPEAVVKFIDEIPSCRRRDISYFKTTERFLCIYPSSIKETTLIAEKLSSSITYTLFDVKNKKERVLAEEVQVIADNFVTLAKVLGNIRQNKFEERNVSLMNLSYISPMANNNSNLWN